MKVFPPTDEGLAAAVEVLRRGGIVAFPTETSYGLAVDPFNPSALRRLFQLKQRAGDKPVLVLFEGDEQLHRLVTDLPGSLRALAAQHWPGPLTLVCPARPELPRLLTGGTGRVGLRRSSHPLAFRLVTLWRGPLTATSANLSGRPPALTAEAVRAQCGDGIDLLIDGGPCPGGVSTLVGQDADGRLELLRAGVVDWRTIERKMRRDQGRKEEGMVDWNREFALEQTGGDEELLVELLSLFRDSSVADLGRLRQAVEAGSSEGVVRAAHSIKGAAASLGFENIRQLALDMETAGRAGSVEQARSDLSRMAALLEAIPAS